MKTLTSSSDASKMSDLEASFDFHWRIFATPLGAPDLTPGYPFDPPRKWHVDRACVDLKIAVELNGGAGGGFGRRIKCHRCGAIVRAGKKDGSFGRELRLAYPSHSGFGGERDAKKINRLMQLGWRVIVITSNMLQKDPEKWVRSVADLISDASSSNSQVSASSH